MNYFVDESGMEIIEKNIYTATEIATVMPFYGNDIFSRFYSANAWTKSFLPNNYMRVSSAKDVKGGWIKWLFEKMLDNPLGNFLDELLMKLTAKSWDKKTKTNKKNYRGLIMGMKASKHYSKPDPVNFQQKILELYENSLENVYNKYDKVFHVANESL